MKDEWKIVKFGEIARNISERVDPLTTDLDVYVGLEHLDPQSLRITRRGVPTDVKGQKLRVRPGQIIFGKRRAYQKKVAVADFDGICSAHAMVLEPVPGKIIPELLPFFMQSDMFMDRAVAISEGSLSPTIKWKTLANQEFPLPPIERQKEIFEVLEKVEKCCLLSEQAIVISSLLQDVLIEQLAWRSIKNIKNNRPTLSLGEIAKVQAGFAFKSKNNSLSGVRWLKIANVGTEEIDWSVSSFLPYEYKDEYIEYLLEENDLVMAMTRPVLSGKVKVAKISTQDLPVLLNQRVARITPKDGFCSTDDLLILLKSKKMGLQIETQISGTDPPNISGKELERISVPYMDKNTWEKIMKTIHSVSACRKGLCEKSKYFKSIRAAMLRFYLEFLNEL